MNLVLLEFADSLAHDGDWTDSAIVRAARAAAPQVAEISRLSVLPGAGSPAREPRDYQGLAG